MLSNGQVVQAFVVLYISHIDTAAIINTLKYQTIMKVKKKYEKPVIKATALEQSSVICSSGNTEQYTRSRSYQPSAWEDAD